MLYLLACHRRVINCSINAKVFCAICLHFKTAQCISCPCQSYLKAHGQTCCQNDAGKSSAINPDARTSADPRRQVKPSSAPGRVSTGLVLQTARLTNTSVLSILRFFDARGASAVPWYHPDTRGIFFAAPWYPPSICIGLTSPTVAGMSLDLCCTFWFGIPPTFHPQRADSPNYPVMSPLTPRSG